MLTVNLKFEESMRKRKYDVRMGWLEIVELGMKEAERIRLEKAREAVDQADSEK